MVFGYVLFVDHNKLYEYNLLFFPNIYPVFLFCSVNLFRRENSIASIECHLDVPEWYKMNFILSYILYVCFNPRQYFILWMLFNINKVVPKVLIRISLVIQLIFGYNVFLFLSNKKKDFPSSLHMYKKKHRWNNYF